MCIKIKHKSKHFYRCLIILSILASILIAWLCNNLVINHHLKTELKSQLEGQSIWHKENIIAWTCGSIRATDTIVVITPEYYEDFYTSERIAAYNVDSRANYVLTAFKRGFEDPYEVAKNISELVKELRGAYSHVIIVGHSKSTTINIAMLKYLSDNDYDKMINISATYSGTFLTMPDKMYEVLSTKKIFNWNYGKLVYDFYLNTFDGDRADEIIREDSPFLNQLDYSKIDKDKFINITAKSGVTSFFYDLWNFDAEGIGLPFLDLILGLNGDGIVPLQSQMANMDADIKTLHLKASHKSSYKIGIKKVLNMLEE